jgi:hypothetical protein
LGGNSAEARKKYVLEAIDIRSTIAKLMDAETLNRPGAIEEVEAQVSRFMVAFDDTALEKEHGLGARLEDYFVATRLSLTVAQSLNSGVTLDREQIDALTKQYTQARLALDAAIDAVSGAN